MAFLGSLMSYASSGLMLAASRASTGPCSSKCNACANHRSEPSSSSSSSPSFFVLEGSRSWTSFSLAWNLARAANVCCSLCDPFFSCVFFFSV
uniref:Putative secreted protein n=1 Tax=Ixodes ricinus TaxID=34613 RepID=A0A6B0UD41_IXORI